MLITGSPSSNRDADHNGRRYLESVSCQAHNTRKDRVEVRTVCHTVCGAPTVRVTVRWTEICDPATMILHVPDLMSEKGMPLYV